MNNCDCKTNPAVRVVAGNDLTVEALVSVYDRDDGVYKPLDLSGATDVALRLVGTFGKTPGKNLSVSGAKVTAQFPADSLKVGVYGVEITFTDSNGRGRAFERGLIGVVATSGEATVGSSAEGETGEGLNITVDVKTRTVRIGGSGVADYNDLENRPSINDVTLDGNKTSDDLGLMPKDGAYSKEEVDEKLENLPESYTKAEADDKFETKEAAASESEAVTKALATKASADDVLFKKSAGDNSVQLKHPAATMDAALGEGSMGFGGLYPLAIGQLSAKFNTTYTSLSIEKSGDRTWQRPNTAEALYQALLKYPYLYSPIEKGYEKIPITDITFDANGVLTFKADRESLPAELKVFSFAFGVASFCEAAGWALGKMSHAEGNFSASWGQTAHAEGFYTLAYGEYSHTEGRKTIARSNSSHAEGQGSVAGGIISHVEGNYTVTKNRTEHAEGNFNKSNQADATQTAAAFGNAGNTLHSVGMGASDSDRKNAHEIMQNGDHYIYGLGGYDGTNPGDASTLQGVIGGLAKTTDVKAMINAAVVSAINTEV